MSKRKYEKTAPYVIHERLMKAVEELRRRTTPPKLIDFERAMLVIQTGGTARFRIRDEILALKLIDGEVVRVEDNLAA